MNTKHGVILLVIAASIAIATALAHLSCIYLGPRWYSAQMAPPSIVESAKTGTLLAPLGTVVVSAIFVIFGCYALSGARLIRRLPLLSFGNYAIASACIILKTSFKSYCGRFLLDIYRPLLKH